MRRLAVLLFIGCLFFSCKSEAPKGKIYQAVVSIHKVYNSLELIEKVKAVLIENDTVGQSLLTELAKAHNYLTEIATRDTASVKGYIAKLNFDKSTTCAFVPLNNPVGGDMCSLIIYEQAPLISETVSLTIGLNENQEYVALFKFADADKWERVTQVNVGRQLAIAVNGVIKSAPVVNVPIDGGNCSVISSDLDKLLK